MAGTTIGSPTGAVKSRSFAQWLTVVAALVVAYIAVTRIIDAGNRALSPAKVSSTDSVLAHCAQFVTLAKARYGDDWKYRLDPRDTVCATEVQTEWEHQWANRQPPPALSATPTLVENAVAAPASAAEPASEGEVRARNPETYCLNVISLARSRYGDDWPVKIPAEEAAGCEEEIRRAGTTVRN